MTFQLRAILEVFYVYVFYVYEENPKIQVKAKNCFLGSGFSVQSYVLLIKVPVRNHYFFLN